jgi:hypothetical protein
MSEDTRMSGLSESHKSRPMVVVEFTLPDGELLTKTWTVGDCAERKEPGFVNEVLPLLNNPRKAWDHPQDPLTFKGDVAPGNEKEVREWLLAN